MTDILTLQEKARIAAANCINQQGALHALLLGLAEALDASEADALIKRENLELARRELAEWQSAAADESAKLHAANLQITALRALLVKSESAAGIAPVDLGAVQS